MTTRIGPKMSAVVAYVTQHPGCPKIQPARYVGPNGSLKFGYDTVNRAIKAGLIRCGGDPTHKGRYRLYPI